MYKWWRSNGKQILLSMNVFRGNVFLRHILSRMEGRDDARVIEKEFRDDNRLPQADKLPDNRDEYKYRNGVGKYLFPFPNIFLFTVRNPKISSLIESSRTSPQPLLKSSIEIRRERNDEKNPGSRQAGSRPQSWPPLLGGKIRGWYLDILMAA